MTVLFDPAHFWVEEIWDGILEKLPYVLDDCLGIFRIGVQDLILVPKLSQFLTDFFPPDGNLELLDSLFTFHYELL